MKHVDLCLDLGNSQLSLGVFVKGELFFNTHIGKQLIADMDLLADFFKQALVQAELVVGDVKRIALASVVPELDQNLLNACQALFSIAPLQVQAKDFADWIDYQPAESLGADRVANALAVKKLFPNENCLVVDLGSATTLCAINSDGRFLGGLIAPGCKLQMLSLSLNTAKLPEVTIEKPAAALAANTVAGIQAGIYFSQLGLVKEVMARFANEVFVNQKFRVIAVGGFAGLFKDENVFDVIDSQLALKGIAAALEL